MIGLDELDMLRRHHEMRMRHINRQHRSMMWLLAIFVALVLFGPLAYIAIVRNFQ